MRHRRRCNPSGDEDLRDVLRQAIATNDPQLAYQAYVLAARAGQLPGAEQLSIAAIVAETPYGNLYVIPTSATDVKITNSPPGSRYGDPGDPFVVNTVALDVELRYKKVPRDVWNYREDGSHYRDDTLVWKEEDYTWGRGVYRAGVPHYQEQNLTWNVQKVVRELGTALLAEWELNNTGSVMAASASAALQIIQSKTEDIEKLQRKIQEAQGDIGLAYLQLVNAQNLAEFGDKSTRKAVKHRFVATAGRKPKNEAKAKCGICGKTKDKHK